MSDNIEERMENKEPIKVAKGRPRKPKPEEEVSDSGLKKSRKPKKLKEISLWRDDRSNYFKQYYQNRQKVECSCEHCGNKFTALSTLKRHQVRSVLCKRIREVKQTNEPSDA